MHNDPTGGDTKETSAPCRLKFWGVRGSIPTPGPETMFYGGNTSCIELRADGELIILDAGTGIRPLGKALAEEFHGKHLEVTVLISHTHWDHIQGLPFFQPAYIKGNRIRIAGFNGAPETFASALSGQMAAPYFPVSLEEMKGTVEVEPLQEMQFLIGKVQVCATAVNHPGIAAGYRFNTSCGSVAYLPDHEPSCCSAELPDSCSLSGVRARELDQAIFDFIRDVDVLVIDSQYDDTEYATHVGWGHGCISVVVKTAIEANVKRLFLFHHDPDHTDVKVSAIVRDARHLATSLGSKIVIDAAREGETVEIGQPVVNAAGV